MLPVQKPLVLLSVVASITLAGCGSSSDSTSSSAERGGGGTGNATSAPASPTTATSGRDGATLGGDGATASGGSGSARPNSSSGDASPLSGGPNANANGARLGADTSPTGDNSIQTYGSEVEGAEKAAAIAAMRSFVLAIAARDYIKVCAGLSSRIRAGLVQASQGCPEVLESLLTISPSEARDSANGTVTEMRVGGGNAFVLFRPVGSSQLNYFVMSLEDGEWMALGLTVGTPLNPAATPGP